MIERDDPRLTAYALGEADGDTAALVEGAVRDSEALRAEVDDIRRTAEAVSAAFASEEAPALRPEQRRAIDAHASAPRTRRPRVWTGLAAATVAAAVATAALRYSSRPHAVPASDMAYYTPGDATVLPPVASTTAAPVPAYARPLGTPAPSLAADRLANVRALGYLGGSDHLAVVPAPGFNTEGYAYRQDSDFLEVALHPLSTFSVDVDTASYANVRRFLNAGSLPPADAVRIEEMVNYFPYRYAPPSGGKAFAAHVEVAPAPWKREHLLVRIGLKAREMAAASRPPSNLVFLIDVSGSMNQPNKLPLVQRSLKMLVRQLDARDRVALVVYAGRAGLVQPSTPGDQKATLEEAIDRLEAGGSTNGGAGIELAYDLATRQFVRGGVNRVVLATDGDFNVGVTDEGSLVRLVQQKAKAGVFLTVLGFGMGNLQDGQLETLADNGNGNYAYIDTEREARKALVNEMTSTLVTVAKDVKIQVEFNPARVAGYRLVGYENRALNPEDFKDDRKDAGEVGAGHAVTALYEVVPVGTPLPRQKAAPLAYQRPADLTAAGRGDEMFRIGVRYKQPESEAGEELSWPVSARPLSLERASADFRFAAAVAQFGMLLRDSPHKAGASFSSVLALAEPGQAEDESGYRAEFVSLVKKAQALKARE